MRSKNLLTILGLSIMFLAAGEAAAKTVDLGFRIGKVISAEISGAPIEIIRQDQFPYPLPAKKLYAVAALKMTSNRSLSSLDYSLVVNGKTYPCVAIVCNMAAFVCSPDAIFPSDNDIPRMLFVLDSTKIQLPPAGNTIRATLKSNLRGRSSVTLNFLSLGSKPFSDCTKIPAAGALK